MRKQSVVSSGPAKTCKQEIEGALPNWYSFLSLLASTRYLRRVVVLQVLGSFMAVMAAVMASSTAPPFRRIWLPVRFSCDSQI